MLKKRGDEGARNVGTLVLLIGLFIIFFVLLVSEDTRKQLLGDDYATSKVPVPGHGISAQGKVLFTTSPGNVYSLEKGEYNLPLTSAHLYVKQQDETLSLSDKVLVSKGLFAESPKTLYFNLDNPSAVTSLSLFFFVAEPSKVYIDFNGNRVFEGNLESSDIPIKLPVKLARKDNTLKVGLTGTYVLTKSVQLTSVSVKKSFTLENRAATRSFALSPSDKAGLQNAYIDYFLNCMSIDSRNQGEVTISLNSRVLFSDLVVCDAGAQTIVLDPDDLKAGSNYLSLEVSRGDYVFEDMGIAFSMSDKFYPQYNFEMDDNSYSSLKCNSFDYDGCAFGCGRDCKNSCYSYSNTRDCYDACFDECEDDCFNLYCDSSKKVVLELQFPNNRERKVASVTVNDETINMDTVQDVFFRDISSAVNRGANYIKIIPKNDFEVSKLVVSLEPKS